MNIDIPALHRKAQQALNQRDYQQAHQYLLAILQVDKYFADAYFLLGIIANDHHNIIKSIQLTEQAHQLSPDNCEYIAYLAKFYAFDNQMVKAKTTLDKLQKVTTSNALLLDTIGVAYSKLGLHSLAVPYFEKAVEIKPNNADFNFNLAASLKFSGKFLAAQHAYEQTISLTPNHYKAHAALSSLGNISIENNHLNTLIPIFDKLKKSDDKLFIGYAIAREYEAIKQYDKSYHALIQAKKDKLSSLQYSLNDDKALFSSIKDYFRDNVNVSNNDEQDQGYQNSEAIFVVGMPRTGTTLVERILSNHNDVISAGELQNFGLLFKEHSQTHSHRVIDPETIAASNNINFTELGKAYINSTRVITGNTPKFIDKMPLNVLYAGFIIKALPKVKIVCLDRNPLDTVVSNFKQLFAVNQSYYDYSYCLSWTAEYYLLFKELITFWQHQYPENFYIINYEKLVNNPEEETKKMTDFCELTWQESCLDIQQNNAPVATASAVQVRQPISNKSVGNWQRFDAYLDEVKRILADKL